jgi:hypothetical protein
MSGFNNFSTSTNIPSLNLSLVAMAIATGTGTREDDTPAAYTTGSQYYFNQDTTIIGARFAWKRASSTGSDSVKISAWIGGTRLVTTTITVANDGGCEAIFPTPLTIAAGNTVTLSYYGGVIQCRVPTASSAITVPDLYSGKALLAGNGVNLAAASLFIAGDVMPTNSFASSSIFCPIEPIFYGENVRQARTVWVEGDSISAGQGTISYSALWTMGSGSIVKNEAVGGAVLAATAVAPSAYVIGANMTALDTAYNPTNPRDLIFFGGTNDIYYGASAATTLGSLWAIIDARKTACPNDRIWVVTAIARGNWSSSPNYGGSDAPYNGALATYNAGIRSQAGAHGAYVIDVASDSRFTDSTVTTWFQGDKCHPTFNGQKALRSLIASALSM